MNLRALAIAGIVAAGLSAAGVGMLGWVAVARAAPFTPELQRLYAMANAWWGGTPTGCSSVDQEIMPHGWLNSVGHPRGGTIVGMATTPHSDEDPSPCVIWIDRSRAEPSEIAQACVTMLHEVGHLHGFPDEETDPTNIMYRQTKTWLPPICKIASGNSKFLTFNNKKTELLIDR